MMEPYLSFLDILCFLYRGTWKNPHFHTWGIKLRRTKNALRKEKQFKMVQHVCEWRMYGGWGKLSAGTEVRRKQHWRWVHKSHLCFWISITYIFIKLWVFLSTPMCLLIAWTLDPPRHPRHPGRWPLTLFLKEKSQVSMRLGFFLPTVNFD